MSNQFLGEIRPFGFNFAPQGWAICAGQLMAISQNTALFSLLGTNFGGNGTSTFALPNLQGCIANAQGTGPGLSSYFIGETGGAVNVALTAQTIPGHTHTLPAASTTTTKAAAPSPSTFLGATGGRTGGVNIYAPAATQSANPATMLASAVGSAGSSQPHNNMAPYLAVTFCISLVGIFPPRQ
jgi:microcystin-dependent protein